MVKVAMTSEVPALLALVVDGEGGDDHVDVAGVHELAAGLGRHGNAVHVIGLEAHGFGNLVGQVDFHALVVAGQVLHAEAGHVGLHADIQFATFHDGLHFGRQIGCRGAHYSHAQNKGNKDAQGGKFFDEGHGNLQGLNVYPDEDRTG